MRSFPCDHAYSRLARVLDGMAADLPLIFSSTRS
jgi:hypothetical protein